MGRASKRMKRQQARQQQAAQQVQSRATEQQMQELFTAGKYDKALEALAQLIQAGDIKAEYLYKGAYSYFMLGDMERAAQWVSNTLSYAPEHVDARLLLARICLAQQREDDALALLDFLAEQDGTSLRPEQAQTLHDMGGFYARTEPAKLQQNYPHLAAYLQVEVPETPVSLTENAPAAAPATNAPQPAPAAQSTSAAAAPAEAEDTLTLLRRLKAKVQGVAPAAPAAQPVASAAPQPAPATPQPTACTSASATQSSAAPVTAQQQIDAVLAKPVSLREKINLLNAFAGAAFVADDYATARAELEAALQLDDTDGATIRNLALTVALQGDKEKALAIAARQQPVAFMLLHAIKQL